MSKKFELFVLLLYYVRWKKINFVTLWKKQEEEIIAYIQYNTRTLSF